MANYTRNDLEWIWWNTTKPLNALTASLFPDDARADEMGNVISRSSYGQHASNYGWEVDHRIARALGGSDHLSNLRALKCATNRGLGGLLGTMTR